jgi:hypothetical protein
MKKERETEAKRPLVMYPIVVSVVAGLAMVLLVALVLANFCVGIRVSVVEYAVIGGLSLVAARLAMAGAIRFGRGRLVVGGVSGMALCLAVGWWVFHISNFQLTADSYQALNAAKVPADLIAELKNAEGSVDETEQQFVADLDGRFGPDHIAPYRETLVESGWNIHRRIALGAMVGFCLCFSLTMGASLARRRSRTYEAEPLAG